MMVLEGNLKTSLFRSLHCMSDIFMELVFVVKLLDSFWKTTFNLCRDLA